MTDTILRRGFSVVSPLCLVAMIAACGSSSSGTTAVADTGSDPGSPDTGTVVDPPKDSGSDASMVDSSTADTLTADTSTADTLTADTTVTSADTAPDTLPDAVAGGTLTLSLDPTLDLAGDTVKATSITAAALLGTSGTKLTSATVTAGSAAFDLSGLAAGDYFIEVNGDADDLVPTHLDDPSKDTLQRVGTKLRATVIGPTSAPVYRMLTFSAGQGGGKVVGFSDGAAISGEHPYVILTLGTPTIAFRLLGSAALVSTHTASAQHLLYGEPFDAWVLKTEGKLHHGDAYKATGGPASCTGCHSELMSTKPATYSAMSLGNGWCYGCHYGTGGSDTGFVDPAK